MLRLIHFVPNLRNHPKLELGVALPRTTVELLAVAEVEGAHTTAVLRALVEVVAVELADTMVVGQELGLDKLAAVFAR